MDSARLLSFQKFKDRRNDLARAATCRIDHMIGTATIERFAGLEQFANFVRATRYVTVAERKPRAEDFPGAPPENLVAGAVVFSPPDHPVPLPGQAPNPGPRG